MSEAASISTSVPEGIDIDAAVERIRRHVLETPLIEWHDEGLWLKCENAQWTGSFKFRGALNRILSATPQQLQRGVVAASAGNHGIGVSLACRIAGAPATVVVPRDVVQRKRQALERLGAEVILAAGDYAVAERQGRRLAGERHALFVSPYNDAQVVAGQGTLGVELARQLAGLGPGWSPQIFVPVSGGGLLAGVGLGLRAKGVAARIIGAQTASAPYFHCFFHGGDPTKIVETPTIADGLAGAVEEDSITWDLVRRVADDIVLVSERDMAAAIQDLLRETGILVEPSAAVSVAAARASSAAGPRVALLSGGNVDPELPQRLLHGSGQ